MNTAPRTPRDDEPRNEQSDLTEGPDGQLYDAEGLVVDEYSDESLDSNPSLDALDVPAAMVDEAILDDAADVGDGIEEIATVDSGGEELNLDGVVPAAGDPASEDEIYEAHSVEDLERATVGHATRLTDGPDGTAHGERFLDSPDKPTPT